MAHSYPLPAYETSIADERTPHRANVALGLSLALQVPALGLLLLGQLTAGGILIYAVVLLALFYGIIKKNYLGALAIFISSYGLSLPFRDNGAIGFSTYFYAYILIFCFILFSRVSKSLLKFLPIGICFFLFWISWTWGTRPMPFGLSVRLLGAMAGMVLTYVAVSSVDDLKSLVWALLLGSLLFIPTVFLFQSGERFGMLQIMDNPDAGNPVSYMAHLAPWIVVGFALLVWVTQIKYKKIMTIGLLTLICVLVFSTSRTNIFFVGLGMLPIIMRALPKRPVFVLFFLLAFMAGSTAVVIKNPRVRDYLFSRLPQGTGTEGPLVRQGGPNQTLQDLDKYSTGRISIMRAGVEKFFRAPFAGVGFGNSEINVGMGKRQVIHSFWVKMLAESGLLGMLPLIVIILWQFFHYIWRGGSYLPGLSTGLFLGMAAYGLVAHGLDLTMWPTYGLALATAELRANEAKISDPGT
jgi:hypothetical protein